LSEVIEVANQVSNGTSKSGKPAVETSPVASALVKFAGAAFLELPSAAVKRIVADGSERAVYEAGWKAYDALVGLTNEATKQIYSNPRFGEIAGRSIDTFVRVQRFQNAVVGAFFSSLWPTIGLPTSNEVEAVREDIRSLRDELAEARAAEQAARQVEIRQPTRERICSPVMVPSLNPGVHQVAVWSGWPIAEVMNDVRN
jgi:hypothetical protein